CRNRPNSPVSYRYKRWRRECWIAPKRLPGRGGFERGHDLAVRFARSPIIPQPEIAAQGGSGESEPISSSGERCRQSIDHVRDSARRGESVGVPGDDLIADGARDPCAGPWTETGRRGSWRPAPGSYQSADGVFQRWEGGLRGGRASGRWTRPADESRQ